MTRPVCRCLPSFTCTCDRCFECTEMLTELEIEQGNEEHRNCPVGACRLKYYHDFYHEHLKCNACRLEAAGYFMLPSGDFALTVEALRELDAGDEA